MREQRYGFQGGSDDEARRIVEAYFAAKRGRVQETDYGAIIRDILTMYEIGDALYHVLQEHGAEILEAVLGGGGY